MTTKGTTAVSTDTTSTDPRAVVEAGAFTLERFLKVYMMDIGIGVQMVSIICKDLFGGRVTKTKNAVEPESTETEEDAPAISIITVDGTAADEPEDLADQVAETPKSLFDSAMQDVLDITVGFLSVDVEFTVDGVIDAAASLEFLVRYARQLNPKVMPPELIPGDDVVEAALELFHQARVNLTGRPTEE